MKEKIHDTWKQVHQHFWRTKDGAASVVHAAARYGERRGGGVTERRDEGSGFGERGEVRRRVRSDGGVRVGWSTWE